MDVIHYSEDIGDQLLEWMAAGEHMLTNDNVDRYLIESRISMQTMIMTAFMNDGMFQKS